MCVWEWVGVQSTAAEGGLLSAPALLALPDQPETCWGTTASCPSYLHLQAEKQGEIRLHGAVERVGGLRHEAEVKNSNYL